MDERDLIELLQAIQNGETDVPTALERLRDLPYRDLGHAKIDNHRSLRQGYPETIFAQGKTPRQVRDILSYMVREHSHNLLVTRAGQEIFAAVADLHPELRYNPVARTISLARSPIEAGAGFIAILTAGTADLPVAEEAAETAAILGLRTERIQDVGVAGVHRLFAHLKVLRQARVIIVVAGMEGALPSVVAGLVDKPVIAVPTSVGYGASFGGLAALLGMLNNCSGGIGVVNIDNGYGAACLAQRICRQTPDH